MSAGLIKSFAGGVLLPHPFLWTVDFDGGFAAGAGQAAQLLAQEVTIPNESSSFAEYGQDNRGGFMPGYGLIQRESFLARSLAINFFESGTGDIEHDFIRPWMIEVGTKGLIWNGGELRGNITVRQYHNTGGMRKGYSFHDVFPTNCEGFTMNYGSQDFLQKTVTFACREYTLL